MPAAPVSVLLMLRGARFKFDGAPQHLAALQLIVK